MFNNINGNLNPYNVENFPGINSVWILISPGIFVGQNGLKR